MSASNTQMLGPLPTPKTITITFVPNWCQDELKVDGLPTRLFISLGPSNHLPQNAQWKFEIWISSSAPNVPVNKRGCEESFPPDKRALMWNLGQVPTQFSDAVGDIRVDATDIKTMSVALRAYADEKDPNALLYCPANGKIKGHFKVIKAHHYYLNLTFKAGSTIAQLVGQQAWRPIMWLNTSTVNSNPTIIENDNKTPYITRFSNFVANWARVIELYPNEQEYKKLYKQRTLLVPVPNSKAYSIPELNINGITSCTSSSMPSRAMSQLETDLRTKALNTVVLPDLPNGYVSEIDLGPYVELFIHNSDSPLIMALSAIEACAYSFSLGINSLTGQAKMFVSMLKNFSQLLGWDHFLAYTKNPVEYSNHTKSINSEVCNVPLNGDLELKGRPILTRLIQRVNWYLGLIPNTVKKFDTVTALRVVLADHKWFNEANTYLSKCEGVVGEALKINPRGFENFKALLKGEGVMWPHSQKLREAIESTGFKYSPTILKRDRVTCDICGTEAYGWRPWHKPWTFHNFLRHPANFQSNLRNLMTPSNDEAISLLIVEAINRRAANAAKRDNPAIPISASSRSSSSI
jgi:hypothetical protein